MRSYTWDTPNGLYAFDYAGKWYERLDWCKACIIDTGLTLNKGYTRIRLLVSYATPIIAQVFNGDMVTYVVTDEFNCSHSTIGQVSRFLRRYAKEVTYYDVKGFMVNEGPNVFGPPNELAREYVVRGELDTLWKQLDDMGNGHHQCVKLGD